MQTALGGVGIYPAAPGLGVSVSEWPSARTTQGRGGKVGREEGRGREGVRKDWRGEGKGR